MQGHFLIFTQPMPNATDHNSPTTTSMQLQLRPTHAKNKQTIKQQMELIFQENMVFYISKTSWCFFCKIPCFTCFVLNHGWIVDGVMDVGGMKPAHGFCCRLQRSRTKYGGHLHQRHRVRRNRLEPLPYTRQPAQIPLPLQTRFHPPASTILPLSDHFHIVCCLIFPGALSLLSFANEDWLITTRPTPHFSLIMHFLTSANTFPSSPPQNIFHLVNECCLLQDAFQYCFRWGQLL